MTEEISNNFFVGLEKQVTPEEECKIKCEKSRKKMLISANNGCFDFNENGIHNIVEKQQILNTASITVNTFTNDLLKELVSPNYSPLVNKMMSILPNLNAQTLQSIFSMGREHLTKNLQVNQLLHNLGNKLSSVRRKQLVRFSGDAGEGSRTYEECHKELVCNEEVVNLASDCLVKLMEKNSLQNNQKITIFCWPTSEYSTFSTQDQQKLFFWKDLSVYYLPLLKEISCYFNKKLSEKTFL